MTWDAQFQQKIQSRQLENQAGFGAAAEVLSIPSCLIKTKTAQKNPGTLNIKPLKNVCVKIIQCYIIIQGKNFVTELHRQPGQSRNPLPVHAQTFQGPGLLTPEPITPWAMTKCWG